MRSIAIVFDDRPRPETTGIHVRRVLSAFGHVTHFLPEQLDQLRDRAFDLCLFVDDGLRYPIPAGLPNSAYWAIDTHLDLAWAEERGRQVEHVFAAQRDGAEQLRQAGLPATWLPLACDPEVHRPHDLPKRWDVAFVGTVATGIRQDLLTRVMREFPSHFVGQCYFEEYARVYSQARIGFNRSIATDINMRVFEVLGCGTLLLTNDLSAHGQADLFQADRELVTYSTTEELLDKLRFYLQRHEARERIARAGQAAAHQRHTYTERMRVVLHAIAERAGRCSVAGIEWQDQSAPTNSASDWLDSVDFIIKSYLRPQALRGLLQSIDQFYPAARVTVGDDGGLGTRTDSDSQACRDLLEAHPHWRLLELPVDSGVSDGRNTLVAHTTRPFVLVLDDDFRFSAETRIEWLWERLRREPSLGLVAGTCIDCVGGRRQLRNSGGTLDLSGEVLTITTRAWRDQATGRREYVPQFCLARREVFSQVRWRGGPGGEHYDFCLQLLRRGWQVAQDCRVLIDHYPATPALPGYVERRLAVEQHQQQFLREWGLRHVVQDGEVILRRSEPGADAWYFDLPRPEVAALVPVSATRILDLGCGAGALGASLMTRQRAEVVGVELNPVAAQLARARLHAVLEGNIESPEIDFPDGHFDCVIAADVLEHLREPAKVVNRIRRWLRPDGCLVASIPNVRHHSVLANLLAGNWTYESAGLLDRDHVRFFTRREIEKLFYRGGWRIQNWRIVTGPGDEELAAGHSQGSVHIGSLHVTGLPPSEAQEFSAYQYLVVAQPDPAFQEREVTSIILVTHNELPYTKACVDSIRLRTDEPFELIVVDNGSSDATLEYLRSLADVTVIENGENRGFPAAANQGLRAAKGRYLLLLNNDTIVTTGWLRRMLDVFDREPSVGLVGPCTDHCGGEQQVPVGYDRLEALDGFAWDWGRFHDRQLQETDRLVGFCLLARREVINQIGLLDERFGIGNFEDDDFCRRALGAGFRAVIARDAFVHHFGSRTFLGSGADLRGLLDENQRKFSAKWQSSAAEHRNTEPAPPTTGILDFPEESPPAQPQQYSALRIDASDSAGWRLVRNQVRLSGCLIVRDNENTIGAALTSLRPYVDELVVVDTGSRDRTPEICRELGARVHTFAWCDDFSAARNVSLAHARGEWLFWMDSDDTIPEACGRGLRALADGRHDPNVLGYVVQVHCPSAAADGGENVTVVDHVKLVRNRPDLRFEGRIHEQIIPAIRRAGGDVAWTDLHVVHSGADHSPEGWQRKLERDLRILGEELRDNPDHPFVLFNLGMTHADAGNHEEAVQALTRSLTISDPGESQVRKAYALLVGSLAWLGRFDEAWVVCQDALARFPRDPELQFRQGIVAHELEMWDVAEQAYLRAMENDDDRHFSSIDRGITGYKARHNLAAVYRDQGRHAEAESQWRRVTADAPDFLDGWRGLAESLLRQGKLDALDSLVAEASLVPGRRRAALLWRSELLLARGKQSEALRILEDAKAESGDDPEPTRAWCQAKYQRGDWMAAETGLRRLVERDARDASARHNLGSVYLRTGRYEAAARECQEAIRLRPGFAASRVHLGYALESLGDTREAIAAWRGVLRIDPANAQAQEALARHEWYSGS